MALFFRFGNLVLYFILLDIYLQVFRIFISKNKTKMKLINAASILLAICSIAILQMNFIACSSLQSHAESINNNNNNNVAEREHREHVSEDLSPSGEDLAAYNQDFFEPATQSDDQDDYIDFRIKSFLAREKLLPPMYYSGGFVKRNSQFSKRPFNPQTSMNSLVG